MGGEIVYVLTRYSLSTSTGHYLVDNPFGNGVSLDMFERLMTIEEEKSENLQILKEIGENLAAMMNDSSSVTDNDDGNDDAGIFSDAQAKKYPALVGKIAIMEETPMALSSSKTTK